MMDQLKLNFGDVIHLSLLTLAFLGSISILRAGVRRIPGLPKVQAMLESLLPLVEVGLGGLWIVLMVQGVFVSNPIFGGVAMVGVLLYGLWLGREPIQDTLAGVILRTGRGLRVGDKLNVDGLEGQIRELGPRKATLQLHNGDEGLVPYTKLSRATIIRTPMVFGAHQHTFRLPPGTDVNRVERAALLSHWSSVTLPPLLDVREEGVHVTIFTLDPRKKAAVEAFIRARV